MQQVQRQSVRPIRFLALELMTQAASNFYNLLIRRHHGFSHPVRTRIILSIIRMLRQLRKECILMNIPSKSVFSHQRMPLYF